MHFVKVLLHPSSDGWWGRVVGFVCCGVFVLGEREGGWRLNLNCKSLGFFMHFATAANACLEKYCWSIVILVEVKSSSTNCSVLPITFFLFLRYVCVTLCQLFAGRGSGNSGGYYGQGSMGGGGWRGMYWRVALLLQNILEETVSGLLDFLTKFNFFCILRTL